MEIKAGKVLEIHCSECSDSIMNRAQTFYYYWLLKNRGLDVAIEYLIVCCRLNNSLSVVLQHNYRRVTR